MDDGLMQVGRERWKWMEEKGLVSKRLTNQKREQGRAKVMAANQTGAKAMGARQKLPKTDRFGLAKARSKQASPKKHPQGATGNNTHQFAIEATSIAV